MPSTSNDQPHPLLPITYPAPFPMTYPTLYFKLLTPPSTLNDLPRPLVPAAYPILFPNSLSRPLLSTFYPTISHVLFIHTLLLFLTPETRRVCGCMCEKEREKNIQDG